MRFWLNLRKQVVFGLIARGLYVPTPYVEKYAEMINLKTLIDEAKIDCVLDVGANIGQFARDLRLIGYQGQIVSFEPLSEAFRQLKSEFANDSNWTGFQIALGSVARLSDFNVGRDTKLSSLLEFEEGAEVARGEKVAVRRLDEVLPEINHSREYSRMLLKMDTQGYDAEVFAGAEGCMSEITAIMSEVSVIPIYKGMKSYKEALKIYESAGFDLYHVSIVSRSAENLIVEMNCLLKR